MSQCETQQKVREELIEIFDRLDDCFEFSPELLRHRPDYPGAWSIAEHLEHVCLANHYLLLTIAKGCAKARRRGEAEPVPEGESDLALLEPIAVPGLFPWEVPSHMIPTGRRDPAATRAELAHQRERALELLAGLSHGEGRLCRIRISVHALGAMDMYQWLCFLARHGRFHLAFINERVLSEMAK